MSKVKMEIALQVTSSSIMVPDGYLKKIYTRVTDFKQSTLFLKDFTKIVSIANVIQNSTSWLLL